MKKDSILYDLKESLSLGATVVGNKTYNLALLRHDAGIDNIPECWTLGSDMTVLMDLSMPDVIMALKNSFAFPIIARSSTNVEDSAVSFAGQFVSGICYNDDELAGTIKKIIYSPNASNVFEYCRAKKIDPESIRVAVLFQAYLPAEMSGVMFTKNPINNNEDEILIEYSDKSSDSVTVGSAIPKIISTTKSADNGISRPLSWPFDELAQIGIQAENRFGVPVDIEWIVSCGKLWIVQARQITT